MLQVNDILSDSYQIMQRIGSGGSGEVYLAYHLRLQKYVVIKRLKNASLDEERMRKEADILKNLHHPNLPQVYDFIREENSAYTVIDYINGFDLETYMQSGTVFSEEDLKKWLRQVADALSYLHRQNPPIIHSDIKPANILINQDGDAILIDFNVSLDGRSSGLLGLSIPYASPEQYLIAQTGGWVDGAYFSVDIRTDLYSLGASFYEMMTGILPGPTQPLAPLMQMELPYYSEGFKMLIDRMTRWDREERPESARHVITSLDSLFKQNSKYWLYFILRVTCSVLCAVMISFGIYFWIGGSMQKQTDARHSRVEQVVQTAAATDPDQLIRSALALTGEADMRKHFEKNPLDAALLYHTMGDVEYNREAYATAQLYYKQAVDACTQSGDHTVLGSYIRDAALAYARSGDIAMASTLLESAKSIGAERNDILLIQAALEARQGNGEKCSEYVRTVLSGCGDREICQKAALLAASASSDARTEIYWLEQARAYGAGKTAQRGLAGAYVRQWQTSTDTAEKNAALNSALAAYSELASDRYAGVQDCINYAVVLRMAGRNAEAIEVLQDRLPLSPDDYRILMNLAFACFETGDHTAAEEYCRQAYEAWQRNPSTDKDDRQSDNVQNLLELMRRYGISE